MSHSLRHIKRRMPPPVDVASNSGKPRTNVQLEHELLSNNPSEGNKTIRRQSPSHNLLQQHALESVYPQQEKPLPSPQAPNKEILAPVSSPETASEPPVEVQPLLRQLKPLAKPIPDADLLDQAPEHQDRPKSCELRSSNQTKSMSRPFSEEECRLQDLSKSTTLSPHNTMKVKKSKSGPNQAENGA